MEKSINFDNFIKLVEQRKVANVFMDDKHIVLSEEPLTGEYSILFPSDDDEECITIIVETTYLYLDNYYYKSHVRSCPPLSHDWFFNSFLKPLAARLKLRYISLIDTSSKRLQSCEVPMMIFALAKGRTFYELYDFKNVEYKRFIDSIRFLTLDEFIKLNGSTEDFTTSELSMRISEMATTVITQCTTEFGMSPTFRAVAKALLQYQERRRQNGDFKLSWRFVFPMTGSGKYRKNTKCIPTPHSRKSFAKKKRTRKI